MTDQWLQEPYYLNVCPGFCHTSLLNQHTVMTTGGETNTSEGKFNLLATSDRKTHKHAGGSCWMNSKHSSSKYIIIQSAFKCDNSVFA